MFCARKSGVVYTYLPVVI